MLVNETIDDTDPRIIFDPYDYSLTDAWTVANGYHASSYYTAVLYTFQGSAIYVNCLRDVTGVGSISITLDDIPLGPFSPLVSSPAERGSGTIFSKTDLDPTLNHTVIVRKVPDNVFEPSIKTTLYFDSFIVTSDTDAPPAKASASHPIPTTSLDVTVDDRDSRVQYFPGSGWSVTTLYKTYGMYDGTLTITGESYKPVSIYFKGSAIRVTALRWWCGSNFTVSLDGVESGPYNLLTDDPTQIRREVIFSAQQLDPQSIHFLAVSALPDSPGFMSRTSSKSYMNIDSFIITEGNIVNPNSPGLPSFPTKTSSISTPMATSTNDPTVQNPPVGPIVGGVIGGIAALAFLIIVLYLLRKRRTSKPSTDLFDITTDVAQVDSRDTPHVTPYTTPATSPALLGNLVARPGKLRNHTPTSPVHPLGLAMSESNQSGPLSGESAPLPRNINGTARSISQIDDSMRHQAVQEQIEELRQEVRLLRERDILSPPIYQELQ